MVKIQVNQSDRGYEDGQQPAKHHSDELVEQHPAGFSVENIVTHDETNYSLVHKAGIGIQQ